MPVRQRLERGSLKFRLIKIETRRVAIMEQAPYKFLMMNFEANMRPKDIHEHIHDIKSSLQSLMVANELVLEGEELGDKNDNLLRTMMEDVRRIHQAVNIIERDFGGGNYDS